MVVDESPLSTLIEKRSAGWVDAFIGLAPCCPPNLYHLLSDSVPKSERKRKLYWFKSCDFSDYYDWDFSRSSRCREMEFAVIDLILHVCEQLPVDPLRIYLAGSSAGGYATFRLAEIIPKLFAAAIPFAGYYPSIPEQDHDPEVAVARLRSLKLQPHHCEKDKVCRIDMPHVEGIYTLLRERSGIEVRWVHESIAAGSTKSYHSPHRFIFQNPDAFFQDLLQTVRMEGDENIVAYLRQRLADLESERC